MKKFLIHPFLFAIFPIIFLFAHNIGKLYVKEILIPLFITLAAAIILLIFFKIVYRDNYKTALTVSLLMMMFFSYGYFNVLNLRQRYFLPIWSILLAAGMYFIFKTKKNLTDFNGILNAVSIILIASSLVTLTRYYFNNPPFNRPNHIMNSLSGYQPENNNLPDIYYIVPDGYANSRTLKEFFNYDNSNFESYLIRKGFEIAPESRSNYPTTLPSVASTLNLDYLDNLTPLFGTNSTDTGSLRQLLENNESAHFLKSKGYKFVTFDSGYSITGFNRYADIFFNTSYVNEFVLLIIQDTMLQPFLSRWESFMNSRILYIFDKLGQIPESIQGPKFVFAHIVLPHWPYIFDAAGKKVFVDKLPSQEEEKQLYLGQLIFTSNKLTTLADELLSKSKNPPIIIIQSDHGFRSSDNAREVDEPVAMKYKNFNAYYLPGLKKPNLPDNISPVNTFRLIFKDYFGVNINLLENKSFRYNAAWPYKYSEISKEELP